MNMPKVLFDRPTGFWNRSEQLPVLARLAGYEYWDQGKDPDPLLVRREKGHYVVVCEWDAPPSLTELWVTVAAHAGQGG
ncbi:MAG: hypothetical protein Q8N61_01420 [bacterium]|nr:hypothetical protein [bacterium]